MQLVVYYNIFYMRGNGNHMHGGGAYICDRYTVAERLNEAIKHSIKAACYNIIICH